MTQRLQRKIKERLEELYKTLKPQILRQYENRPWLYRDESESEDAGKTFFLDQMKPEIEHSLKFFAPQIKVIYRDISREDAESSEFRKEVEKAFGEVSADQLFAAEMKNKTVNTFNEKP